MLHFDPFYYPNPSQRNIVYGHRGMVATSQPLAAQVGLDILRKGGNAIDAALATAGALTVTEPTSNGIGGDAFALVWYKGELHGLNASGPSPRSISLERLKEKNYSAMPSTGFAPVTVPGIPGAWAYLNRRMGQLPLTQVLQGAVEYARHGFPVSPTTSFYWKQAVEQYRKTLVGEEFAPFFSTFAPLGRAPEPGERWVCPHQADTLTSIAETEAQSFYQGELAERMDAFSRQYGGYLRGEDLADFSPQWVEPISINYRGFDVWELPPNGQGLITLMALNILKGFSLDRVDRVHIYHLLLEAMKLAFVDGRQMITDPSSMKVSIFDLLSPRYGEKRRSLIKEKALFPEVMDPSPGGTVYLATADEEGNMVSYIQSNYKGFGSGLVVPGTGISLQNRGHTFSLHPQDVNVLEPGKRTYHTIIPGFLTQDQKPLGPFGVMGGFMQPQGHLQVLVNTIDFHYNPQAALDAPRWMWDGGRRILVEPTFPQAVVQALLRQGHEVEITTEQGLFGRGQIIWRDPAGVYCGGSEPRTDGLVAAW